MPALKLTYFDLRGRAGVIRKTLTLGRVPFVDERLSQDEFQQLKPTLPYGKLPVLEIDGEVVAETHAILRYAGRVSGMYPSPECDPLAGALIDEAIDSLDELFEGVMMPSLVETDTQKKKQLREALLAGPLPRAFELLNRRLAQILEYAYFKSDPERVTLLDMVVWDWVHYMRSGMVDHIPTSFIDEYKTMVAMYDKVEASPGVGRRETFTPQVSPSPKTVKLTYFNMPGRAEQIRLAFHIGGVPFEDERLSSQDFATRKSSFPNEQVPVLQVDGGIMVAQSVAILRYVGALTGLYPSKDPLEALRIDEVLSHIGELNVAVAPLFQERDPEKKRQQSERLTATTIPELLRGLDKRLAHWKNQCTKQEQSAYAMGGDTPMIADLGIYSLVQFLQSGVLDHVPTTIVDQYDEIVKASEAVKQHPRVVAWYAKASQPAV